VSRRTIGITLLVLAGMMLYGFLRSSASIGAPSTIIALLITVILPAGGGIALLREGGGSRRMETLRQQTIEAEILRMAVKEHGKLTAMEVATALALPTESAKEALDALVERDLADMAITDAGVIVYTFHDAKHIGGKSSARGVLE
jgi:hypothetical protein